MSAGQGLGGKSSSLSSETTDVLSEAFGIIRGDRLQHYGPPNKNFERIAGMWSAYLGDKLNVQISVNDVCAMMILLKQARMADGGYHRDSSVDTAGYAALQEILADGINLSK